MDEGNTVRVDPEEDIVDTGIYRDFWERAPLTLEDGDGRLKDVWISTDYPSMQDFDEAMTRGRARQERLRQEDLDFEERERARERAESEDEVGTEE